MQTYSLPVHSRAFCHRMNRFLLPLLLIFAAEACSKEDMKPGSDYTGHLTMEYIRSFPGLTAQVRASIDLYASGNVIVNAPDPVPYTALDSLAGATMIKAEESGTVTVSSLSGNWTVISNAGYVTVNAHVVIEGVRRIWNRDSQDEDWVLSEEIPISIEDPVDYPLEFKLIEAEQPQGAVQGESINEEVGSVTYQWILRLDPV